MDLKYFGTDGFRGVANEGLNVDHAFKIGRFVGWFYGLMQGRKARIVIGKDTRRSSYMFESALVAGLVASGADAYMLHVIPTPGVSYVTADGNFDCGIMITASHNPFTDNGIKLVNNNGEKMDDAILSQVENYIDGKVEVPLATGDAIGQTIDFMQGRNRYIAHLIASANFSLQGVKVGLDCANGAASSVAKPVFDALGADVYVFNNTPNGFNINVNCGSTHIDQLQGYVLRNNLDVGFAYDGDADRCLVDGDLIMYVCGRYLNQHGGLAKSTVVPTVMSNFGFFKALEEIGINHVDTAVGDKYVYAKMREEGYSLGGEQSGHIIFGEIENTGDGIMTSLKVMEAIRAQKESLATLVRPVKLYPQQLDNVKVQNKNEAMESAEVLAAVKKAQEFLGDRGRCFVRASGTEDLVRVLAEAPDAELCRQANDFVLEALKPYMV